MTAKTQSKQKMLTTKLVVTAMLTAVAVVLQYIEFSIPIVPSFLKLDFSDLPELIGAFAIGPWWGVVICFLKNLIHLPFGSSMAVGELSNFMLGAVFSVVAGYIYRFRRTKGGALAACLAAAAAMALVSFPLNNFIVYPAYSVLWTGGDMEPIIGMYRTILPAADTLPKALLIFNIPFTLGKGLIDALLAMLIYKPLSRLIEKMNESFVSRKKAK